MRFELHHGDSREALKSMAEASVDSIVTDPPYELGFMGKGWDRTGVANDPALWRECLRVLKPGGYLLAFSGTRTYHRMTCAIEDAGFEVRDQIGWLYGSGFPKSHNGEWGGTALKPAWEPIAMARKPLVGTVEANWLAYGTGALNIDGCRVGLEGAQFEPGYVTRPTQQRETEGFTIAPVEHSVYNAAGRWPANIIHDGSEEVIAAFPEASGQSGAVTGEEPSSKTNAVYGQFNGRQPTEPRGDTGSAARFFYCAKASKEDRDDGLRGFAAKSQAGDFPALVCNVCGCRRVLNGATTCGHGDHRREVGQPRKNHHPTVKPSDLMRYLCRLVTPKDGLVLDPFMGSGSTGKAAMLEGFRFVGIDLTAEYVEIARARIEFARKQGHQPDLLESA